MYPHRIGEFGDAVYITTHVRCGPSEAQEVLGCAGMVLCQGHIESVNIRKENPS